MSELELIVTGKTLHGGVHVQVNIDKDDSGVLYLTREQFINLSSLLQTGCFNKDVDFKLVDPYNIV